jgi:hypothetical protein
LVILRFAGDSGAVDDVVAGFVPSKPEVLADVPGSIPSRTILFDSLIKTALAGHPVLKLP